MDWQSEDGQRLHEIIDDSIVSDNFTGRFRLELRGQSILIGFNNANGDCVKLYNWYSKIDNWKDSQVNIEQDNPDEKYIYDCYCKKQMSESEVNENKSKVEITKIDDISFNYKQMLADKVLIDCKFYNLAYYCVDSEINRHTVPTEVPIKFCENFLLIIFIMESLFYIFIQLMVLILIRK